MAFNDTGQEKIKSGSFWGLKVNLLNPHHFFSPTLTTNNYYETTKKK